MATKRTTKALNSRTARRKAKPADPAPRFIIGGDQRRTIDEELTANLANTTKAFNAALEAALKAGLTVLAYDIPGSAPEGVETVHVPAPVNFSTLAREYL